METIVVFALTLFYKKTVKRENIEETQKETSFRSFSFLVNLFFFSSLENYTQLQNLEQGSEERGFSSKMWFHLRNQVRIKGIKLFGSGNRTGERDKKQSKTGKEDLIRKV